MTDHRAKKNTRTIDSSSSSSSISSSRNSVLSFPMKVAGPKCIAIHPVTGEVVVFREEVQKDGEDQYVLYWISIFGMDGRLIKQFDISVGLIREVKSICLTRQKPMQILIAGTGGWIRCFDENGVLLYQFCNRGIYPASCDINFPLSQSHPIMGPIDPWYITMDENNQAIFVLDRHFDLSVYKADGRFLHKFNTVNHVKNFTDRAVVGGIAVGKPHFPITVRRSTTTPISKVTTPATNTDTDSNNRNIPSDLSNNAISPIPASTASPHVSTTPIDIPITVKLAPSQPLPGDEVKNSAISSTDDLLLSSELHIYFACGKCILILDIRGRLLGSIDLYSSIPSSFQNPLPLLDSRPLDFPAICLNDEFLYVLTQTGLLFRCRRNSINTNTITTTRQRGGGTMESSATTVSSDKVSISVEVCDALELYDLSHFRQSFCYHPHLKGLVACRKDENKIVLLSR